MSNILSQNYVYALLQLLSGILNQNFTKCNNNKHKIARNARKICFCYKTFHISANMTYA